MRFIGDSFVWHNLVPPMDIELEHGKDYNVAIVTGVVGNDGQLYNAPTMMINGVMMPSKETDARVYFADDDGNFNQSCAFIPYNISLLSNHWQME